MCAHDITLTIWVNQIEMAFRSRAADPTDHATDTTKLRCARTSGQGGIGPDQQGDVATPLRQPAWGVTLAAHPE